MYDATISWLLLLCDSLPFSCRPGEVICILKEKGEKLHVLAVATKLRISRLAHVDHVRIATAITLVTVVAGANDSSVWTIYCNALTELVFVDSKVWARKFLDLSPLLAMASKNVDCPQSDRWAFSRAPTRITPL